MELKMKEKSYYSTIGLMGFREFLISEQSEADTDRDTDREIDSVRNRIQLKKKQILLKQLTRSLKIIDDKERTMSTNTRFIR